MPMLSFPLTPQWLDHVLELADTPWCCDAFDAVFVRHGWAIPAEDDEVAVGWLDHWPLGDPAAGAWHVVLGEYPGCADTDDRGVACDDPECHENSFLVLPLAYAAIDATDAYTGLPVSQQEFCGGEPPSQAAYLQDARSEDFTARYDDAARMLRARLGDPLPVAGPLPPDEPDQRISWERGKSLITLFLGANWYNYAQDDWIGIDIRPMG
ncbi:hypothetical protein [Streptomyces sp. NPDC053427]|uniref:hypothetical protein n=1 Tax=Streptomyces sp. NPDC053427 TaxID=3365701 RepID=UPI0037CF1B23